MVWASLLRLREEASTRRPTRCAAHPRLLALHATDGYVLRPGSLPHAACADEASRTLRAKSWSQRGHLKVAARQNQGLICSASPRSADALELHVWNSFTLRASISLRSIGAAAENAPLGKKMKNEQGSPST